MAYASRVLIAAMSLLASVAAQAVDRSQCKQYGGSTDCWDVALGPWDWTVCGEVGPGVTSYSIAVCRAEGGTWNGSSCDGLPPPELRRPATEGDIGPFAGDIFREFHGPLCEGPNVAPFAWGGTVSSVICPSGSGATLVRGYERGNLTDHFPVSGKKLESGVCSTTDTVLNFMATRLRPVGCPGGFGQDQSFAFTSGADPALCNLGIRSPVNPKQPCVGCGSVKVGNPIDPITGVKQQIELDYAGSGPQPLRFERIYQNRIYVMDGKQWRHNYSARIVDQNYGTRPVAMAIRATGRTFLFALTGAEYLPDTDIDDRLTRLTDAGGAHTGWQYYDAQTESSELYDPAGKLLYITSRAGLTQSLEYSTVFTPPSVAPFPGLLVRVTDAFGRQLNFTYDALGRLLTLQDPAGQTYAYTHTSQHHFASVTYPDGKVRTYLYNEPAFLQTNFYDGRLTGLVDENGARFGSYSYDGSGLARASENALGANAVSLNFGSWPSRVSVTDARGTVRSYDYALVNGAYRNTAVIQPAASGTGTVSSTRSYDGNGNLTVRRDFNGNRMNYTYDLARNLETSRTEGLTSAGATTPSTRTIDTEWHPTFRLPTRITEKNSSGAILRETVMSHDAAGNVLSRTVGAGGLSRTWSYTYNANGSVLTANGPRTDVSDITTYTYYANDDPDLGKRGNLATVTNALGHVTQITAYNAHGQPLTVVDPNGVTTTLAYDLRQRLTSREVGGELTSYEYDGVGQLTRVVLPDGSSLAYTYDAAHRLTAIADALGNRISYTLDAMGNRTQEQVLDPLGALAQTRSRVYNSLNRLFQEIGAQNQTTQYGYDNQGNVTSVDGPLAGTVDVTTNQYDALNRLLRVTDPNAGQVNYGYNALDQLVSVSDPRSLVTSYSYNGLGDLNQQVSPDTGTTTNTYDSAGNLATSTDAKGQVTSYAYDALNRVTRITFHDGSRQDYLYDQGANGLGRLAEIQEFDAQSVLTGRILYSYDAHGRVLSQSQAHDGLSFRTLGYEYDSFGRVSRITYPYSGPASGGSVSYGYDGQGRVLGLSATYWSERVTPAAMVTRTIVDNVAYQPFGGVKGFTFGNGQAYSRPHDQDGRVASYTLGGAQFDLAYDPASRITGLSQAGNPGNANTYGYDALDRLTSAVVPATSYGYSYDPTGNRLTKNAGAGTDTYAYPGTSNRLSSITPSSGPVRTYVHDAVGSVTDDGEVQYAYDARGRMVRASIGGCTVARYRVNALGQRVRKQSWPVSPCQPAVPTDPPQKDTLYTYDLQGHLIAENHTYGVYKRAYVYLGDWPVAMLFQSDD